MLFRVTKETLDNIEFYMVPDDPSIEPKARIEFEEYSETIKPTQVITSLLISGRHSTGLCGFNFQKPEFLKSQKLSIYDAETNLLIYRDHGMRKPEIEKRVLVPKFWSNKWEFEQSFIENFNYHYIYERDIKSIETLEEVLQNHCRSCCISGQIPTIEILHHLKENIELWILLDDPLNCWDTVINGRLLPEDFYRLTPAQMISLSNPLLKLVTQKDNNYNIIANDIQTAYKIFSQAAFISLTDNILNKPAGHTKQNQLRNILKPNELHCRKRKYFKGELEIRHILTQEDHEFFNNVKNILKLQERI